MMSSAWKLSPFSFRLLVMFLLGFW